MKKATTKNRIDSTTKMFIAMDRLGIRIVCTCEEIAPNTSCPHQHEFTRLRDELWGTPMPPRQRKEATA